MNKSTLTRLFAVVAISCLGIIVYSNTFHCSFHFDDDIFIIHNFAIRNIYNLQNIWQYFHGRFFTFLSLAFNYHFEGLDVFGYHVFNLGIHLGAAIFVWWLTLLTLSTPVMKEEKIARHANLISLFAGLVFVSHPVQIEAVTYIWQRAASMVALFYLASLCFYVKSRLLQEAKQSFKVYYICSLLAAVIAMFTKENAVTLPLMILLYECTFLKTKKNLDWKYISPFLLTIVIIPVTLLFIRSTKFQDLHGDFRESGDIITPMHYLLTQFRVMFTYIRLVFLPINQNLDYDYPIFKNIFELPVLISFLSLIAILYWAKHQFSKYRLVSFSIFWFFLTLIPESSIWVMGNAVFEHRLYLPLVGYSIFLVSGVFYLLGKNSIKMMVIILSLIIACNSVLTYQRNKVWKNEFTLWNDAVQKSPHKARPYLNRGRGYLQKGKLDQAMADLNKSIDMCPNYAVAYIDRGIIDETRGKLITALIEYTKAIIVEPKLSVAYYRRGLIYKKLGSFSRSIADFTKVIEINPDDAGGYALRGSIFSEHGNFDQAIVDFNKSIQLDQNFKEAYRERDAAYAHLKKHDMVLPGE